MQLKFTGIIPARFGSSRFPGKPLALVNGKPMVIRVWESTKKEIEDVYIATDCQKIREVAEKAGAKVIMTSEDHLSGTDRIIEAAEIIFKDFSNDKQVILNIQGDEPLISRKAISDLCKLFSGNEVEIATLVKKISDPEEINNTNRVKTVLDRDGNALYFSRLPIPYNPGTEIGQGQDYFYQHIGIYAFRLPVLSKIAMLDPSILEKRERLEQLRWLENGFKIRCVETDYHGFGIDTPQDLDKLNSSFK